MLQNIINLINNRTELFHKLFDGKKAFLDYPPLWVTIGITGNCTFKCEFCCSHCPDSGINSVTSHQYKIPFNMSFNDCKRIIDLCFQADVPHIHICGTGEPFLHPQILKIIDYLSGLYPHDVSLQTDFGKRLFQKKHYVDEIIKRKNHISRITTDIFPEEIHNKIKKGSDFQFLLDCMERISNETENKFDAHVVLNKFTYNGINELIRVMHSRNIRFTMNIVNIFPYGFNEFTSMENVYMSSDTEITHELENVRNLAKSLKISVKIPDPWNEENIDKKPCMMFWQKIQIMPSKKLPKIKWIGNAIPQQCNAVVCGELYSVGNILDYDNFMTFWNNKRLLTIRKQIIEGKIPDEACLNCYTGCYGEFKKLSLKKQIESRFIGFLYRKKQFFN